MNNSLLDLLRNGGYILYARHGEATVGEDQPNLSFQYCYTQRNLSEMGKRQSIYYGEALRHSASEQERILDDLRSKLEMIPPQGTNQVIIAHNFPRGIGLGQIPDMGTVIVKPLGQGNGFEIVAKLSLEDLTNLSRQ